eukprot:10848456-Alexandrium_andersonii.AAC.1
MEVGALQSRGKFQGACEFCGIKGHRKSECRKFLKAQNKGGNKKGDNNNFKKGDGGGKGEGKKGNKGKQQAQDHQACKICGKMHKGEC